MVILDTKTKTILGKNTNWYREESSINATVADYAVNDTAAISLSVREDRDLRAHPTCTGHIHTGHFRCQGKVLGTPRHERPNAGPLDAFS